MGSPETRRFEAATILLVLLAAVLRLPALARPLWLDEVHSTVSAATPGLAHMAGRVLASLHPALYFALLKGWTAVFGGSDAAARALTLVLGLLLVAVLVRWLAPASPVGGLAAGALVAVNPLLVRYGTEVRGYTLLALLLVAAGAAVFRLASVPDDARARLAFALALPAAMLTHVVAVLWLPAFLAAGLVAARPGRRRDVVLSLAPGLAASAAVLGALWAVLTTLHVPLHQRWIPPTTLDLAARCFDSLFGLFDLVPGIEKGRVPPEIGFVPLLGGALAVVASRERLALALLTGASVSWLGTFAVSLFGTPIVWDRILLPGLPYFLAAVAVAAASVRGRGARVAAGSACAGLCLAWALTSLASAARPVEDYRAAGALVAREFRSGDAVVVFPPYAAKAFARYLPTEAAAAAAVPLDGPGGVFLLLRPDLSLAFDHDALSSLLRTLAARFRTGRITLVAIEPIDARIAPRAKTLRDAAIADALLAFGPPDVAIQGGLLFHASWRARERLR
ncbi:MAG: glycosyltransferase family 39 protein [Acidobacteriota bacterium]